MRAGELNKLISIENQTTVSDGMGGETVSWGVFAASVWAAIWPVSAKEQIRSMHEQATISHRIRIRYRIGINASMRIKYSGRIFNIVSPPINPNSSNRILELMTKEVV